MVTEYSVMALARMDHPNIAEVLDAGTTGQGTPASVLECGSPLPLWNEEKRAREEIRSSHIFRWL